MSKKMSLKPLEEWKEYQISELFNIYRGKRYKKEDHIRGKYNYVSSKDMNNGVDGKVEKIDKVKVYKNVLGINNSGSVGKVFYHRDESIFSDHVTILDLKIYKLNKYIALFLVPIIEQIKGKYLFAREMKNSRLEKEYIKLPTKDNIPDWKYMEEYMKYLEQLYLPKLEEITKSKNEKKVELIPVKEWEEFELIKYFDMKTGKYYSKSEYGRGKTPLVSTTDINNGILDYIDVEPIFDGNTLTIGKVGCVCYYQNNNYVASPDVTVLEPIEEKFNKYNGLFISRVVNMESEKWSYGRQIRLGDCMKLIIKLPSKNNEPDWEYMEEYIKSLAYSNKI